MERAKGNWELLAAGPIHAMDIWALACMVFEVLARPIRVPTDIKETASLPREVVRDYQRMLATAPTARITASAFLMVRPCLRCWA